MADFAALAKRLIDAKGREVALVQQGNVPLDSDKPWRGRSEYPRARVVGMAVFTVSNADNTDNVKRNDQFMLFAAANDGGHRLEDFDIVEDGGRVWKILSTQLIGPADTRVLYKFGVSR